MKFAARSINLDKNPLMHLALAGFQSSFLDMCQKSSIIDRYFRVTDDCIEINVKKSEIYQIVL